MNLENLFMMKATTSRGRGQANSSYYRIADDDAKKVVMPKLTALEYRLQSGLFIRKRSPTEVVTLTTP